jgi:hypothetical protein
LDDLISCFKAIDSLYRIETEVILKEKNLYIFEYLSRFLDKRTLLKACKDAHSNVSSIFRLSSDHFQFLYENDLLKLNDFKLIVNGKTFDINFLLLCCVSDKLQAICTQEEELNFTIPKEYLPCFISFLDIFTGLPFYFEDYSLESVSYLIHLFGISSLSQFICKNLASPQNVQEAIEFLSDRSCELYSQIFEQSFSILVNHFSEIRHEQFLQLLNFILESSFQSPQIQINNENILFILVIDLIKRDPNRKNRVQIIYFPATSSSLLIKCFSNFSAEEIDSDLFEFVKTRFFCDVTMPTSPIFKSQWRNQPASLTKEEIEEVLQLL